MAPDTIYQFHPGGAGIKFAQRYANLGVKPQMPMFLPVFSMDLRKIQADAEGHLMPKVLSKVLSQQPDAFAAECEMK